MFNITTVERRLSAILKFLNTLSQFCLNEDIDLKSKCNMPETKLLAFPEYENYSTMPNIFDRILGQ